MSKSWRVGFVISFAAFFTLTRARCATETSLGKTEREREKDCGAKQTKRPKSTCNVNAE